MFPGKKVKLAMAMLAAVSAASMSNAANAGVYGGLGILSSEVEPRVNQSGFQVTDDNSAGGQIFLGADLSRRFSVEGYYADLGEAELADPTISGSISYEAAGLSALLYLYSTGGSTGLIDRRGLLFYGRAGLGYLENDSSNIPFDRLRGVHVSAGFGAEYNLRNGFGVRAEFQNLDQDARYVSFNILKRFGGSSSTDDALADLVPTPVEEKTVPPVVENPVIPPVARVETPVPAPVVTPEVPNIVPDTDGDGVLNGNDLCADTSQGAEVASNGCVFSGVIKDLNFRTNSASLTPAATASLDAAILEYALNPSLQLVVQAHTDNRGDARNNMALSRLRAETVVRYLADVGGIDLGRMSAVGFGESRPVVSNQTPEGRFANRRVEIEIAGGR